LSLDLSRREYLAFALVTWAGISVVWLGTTLPHRDPAARRTKLSRLGVWLTVAALEALCVASASIVPWLLIYGGATIAALLEIGRASRAWKTIAASAAIAGACAWASSPASLGVFAAGAVVLFALPFDGRAAPRLLAAAAITACYVSPLFALASAGEPRGAMPVAGAVLLLGHASDICSGFGGQWGSARPFRRLSPNKTLLGYGCGLGGAIALAVLLRGFATSMSAERALVTAVATWIVAGAGDLLGSKFKRIHRIKDFSSLLGPHGGFGDRLDALSPCLSLSLFLWAVTR